MLVDTDAYGFFLNFVSWKEQKKYQSDCISSNRFRLSDVIKDIDYPKFS